MKRTLSLRTDALGELTTEELAAVAGGAADHTTPLVDCVTDFVSNCMIPTGPICLVTDLVC